MRAATQSVFVRCVLIRCDCEQFSHLLPHDSLRRRSGRSTRPSLKLRQHDVCFTTRLTDFDLQPSEPSSGYSGWAAGSLEGVDDDGSLRTRPAGHEQKAADLLGARLHEKLPLPQFEEPKTLRRCRRGWACRSGFGTFLTSLAGLGEPPCVSTAGKGFGY